MGKFGIGARVRDDGGDEGVIVDKAKGQRFVQYDDIDYGKLWQPKDNLTALPANDNASPSISAEISEKAYVAGDGETVSAWVPRVGDRVRSLERYGSARVGDEGTINGFWDADGDPMGGFNVELASGRTASCYAHRVEPVVAPATTWAPVVGERVLAEGRGYGDTKDYGIIHDLTGDPVNGAFVEFSDGWVGGHPGKKGDGAKNRWYFNLDSLSPAPLTIEAGKFYRTRDGRKVGPMSRDSGSLAWPWEGDLAGGDSTPCFSTNGRWWGDDEENPLDLVAEWVEPESKSPWASGKLIEPVAVAEATATPAPWKMAPRTEPAAPPAKFKVGGRVVIVNHDKDTGLSRWGAQWKDLPIGSEHTIVGTTKDGKNWRLSGSALHFWTDSQLAHAPAPSIPVGTTVTFTATGRLSAYTTDGHAQIVFPGLTPGQNSFALPAAFVALAN